MPRLVVPGRELRGPRDWPAVFGRSAPLCVEIGFGKDTFLLEKAAAEPASDHVGVERDAHRVERFLRAAAERGLENVRALPVSAELALGLCFADASVAELHVYFPDPWPKERHAAHRLVQPWFGHEVARVLEPGGTLSISTDDEPYAAQILEVLGAAGLERVEAVDDDATRHATKFERLWRDRGRAIHHMTFRRRGPGSLTPWTGSGARGDSPT